MNKIRKDREYDQLFIDTKEAIHTITPKTLLIVVDTYRPSFTQCPELLDYTKKIVVLDHHRRGAQSIEDAVLTYQEPYASSTCELVTEILQYVEERIKLKEIEAEALYAGIIVDTKNFMFKTGVRTFEAAAYLRRQGVDTVSVKQIFQDDLECYISISEIVQNAEVLHDGMAISEGLPNTKNSLLIAAKAADQLISLSGISAAFVLSYTDDGIHISGRSLGETNVQVILEQLGGGGHLTMAGTHLKSISIEEAKAQLKNAIEKYVLSNISGS